jgi:ligand-binding sensor domain-containing protein
MRSITLLIVLAFAATTQAQQLVLRHLDEERGLPSNCVLDLHVDQEGLLWVATNNGLYRYDGFTYERIGVGTPIDEVNIVHMRSFPQQELMVFAAYGMRLFFMKSGRLREVQAPDNGPVWADNGAVSSMALDATGELIVGFSNTAGRGRVDLTTGRMTLEALEPDGYAGHVELINGQLAHWLRPADALSHLIDTITLGQYRGTLRSKRIQGDQVFRGGTLGDNGYWVVHSNKMKIIHPERVVDTSFTERILGVTQDGKGRLWLRHWPAGLRCLDSSLNEVHFRAPELEGSHITACVEDRQGGLWFGTIDRGLYYCASSDVHVLTTRFDLNAPTVSTLQPFNDTTVLIGTSNGQVFAWDGRTRPASLIAADAANSGIDVKGILLTPDGTLYPGRLDEAVDLRTRRKVYHTDRDHTWIGVYKAQPIEPRKYLLATVHGLQVADLEHPQRKRYVLDKGHRCYQILPGPDHGYMVATQKGVFRLRGTDLHPERSREQVLQDRTYDILWKGDTLWAATAAGLVMSAPAATLRPMPQGVLANGAVRALALQQERWLWVATMDGLFQIDLTAWPLAPRRFGRAQGLPSDAFTDVAVAGDRIWAISGAEVCSFHLGELSIPTPAPPLRILSILGNDSVVPTASGRFPSEVNNITIRLRHPDHARFHRAPFRYRTSTTAPWTTSAVPRIDLIGLAPGSYVLEVQAVYADGHWSGPVRASWTIAAPLWQRPDALALFSILALLLVAGATSYYRARQHREQLLAAEVQHYHHKALLAQMEPHFLYNALNSIQGFVATNDVPSATRYIARFAKLMRGLLNAAHNDHITLREEMDTLEHYCALEALRSDPPFTFAITADAGLIAERVQLPSFLVQPYVENAIRHGLRNLKGQRAGHLEVRFMREGSDRLRCTIEDNGVGRTEARTLTEKGVGWRSLGTRINLERLPLLDQMGRSLSIVTEDLHTHTGEPFGTRVVVIAPLRMLAPEIERTGANDAESTDRRR